MTNKDLQTPICISTDRYDHNRVILRQKFCPTSKRNCGTKSTTHEMVDRRPFRDVYPLGPLFHAFAPRMGKEKRKNDKRRVRKVFRAFQSGYVQSKGMG